MKTKVLLIALAGIITFNSCKKASGPDAATTFTPNINDIIVPANFNWQSSRTLNFTVAVTDTRFQNAVHVISIYDGDPNAGGNLLAKGSATLLQAYSSNVTIPALVQTVYVVKTSPDNSKIIQTVVVGNSNVSLSIGATDLSVTSLDKSPVKAQGNVAVNTSPDCNSGCTVPVITTSNTNINVNTGDVVCITGSNITVGFNANGGTVRICGTNVTVQNGNLNNNATLIITSSGSANLNGVNINGTSAAVYNYGIATYNGSFSPNGIFENDGTFTTGGDLNINSGGTFTNNGTLIVKGTMNVNTSNVSVNNGSITTSTDFTINSNATVVNKCSIYAHNNYNDNNIMQNYNLVKADNTTTINSGASTALFNGAMLETVNMMLNGSIVGNGATSLVKVSGSTTINSGATVQNAIQYCAAKGIATNYGKFTGGATQDCSLYIPVSGCNADGNGSPAIIDSDGDGVPDNLDDYPNDPTKAYNNYNPAGAGTTLAFEDQWPYKADYDLNDLVITYKYTIVTNAKNIVVQVLGNFTLMATGGQLGNGFGVEFPIPAASMSGLTGATQESGQTNAVAILFSNMRNEMSQWNTIPGMPQSPVKSYSISFNVLNGPSISTFGMNDYNPFIWNYGLKQYRGREIHLAGKTPTSLGDQTLFGTQDDNSSVAAGRYYVTKTGLPFAISVPTATFAYPIETVDITQAFLHFGDWAQSGGTLYTDWYSNTAAGYRNTANIYTK